jgi:glycosyltransferase involved in cell wall biosynthesis
MKICFEAYNISDSGQGSEDRIGYNWLKTVSQFSTECVAFTRPESIINDIPANCKIIKVPRLEILNPKRYWLNKFELFNLTLKFIRYRIWLYTVYKIAKKIDDFDIAIHATQGSLILGTELWRLKCPTIICGSGFDEISKNFNKYLSLSEKISTFLRNHYTPTYIKHVDYVFSANHNNYRCLKKRKIKCSVLADAIPSHLNSLALKVENPSHIKKILWFSSSKKRKGGKLLEEAWNKKNRLNIELHVAGNFQLKGNKIINHGYLSEKDLLKLVGQCHAVVIPSFREGFSTAAAESLSMGIPIIAFENVGPASFPQLNHCIVVSTKDDPILNLDKILSDIELGLINLKSFEKAAIEAAEELWGKKRHDTIKEIFSSLLRN